MSCSSEYFWWLFRSAAPTIYVALSGGPLFSQGDFPFCGWSGCRVQFFLFSIQVHQLSWWVWIDTLELWGLMTLLIWVGWRFAEPSQGTPVLQTGTWVLLLSIHWVWLFRLWWELICLWWSLEHRTLLVQALLCGSWSRKQANRVHPQSSINPLYESWFES